MYARPSFLFIAGHQSGWLYILENDELFVYLSVVNLSLQPTNALTQES